ncbi:type IV pilus assembly protein PilW [Isoalcanivorax pacificus W11-5]|uniref:Type IV pilus assembly protein PilW n=1 Tax=Isoalcanivorax pacificus W11-5 TaxID=391936 RepID=A0A0B4XG70_9GAMM|nr:type IV pilus assembly protein PilW [Isoalcanivorax pacificus W11-5]
MGLVEIMVALVVGMLLITGVVQVYTGSRTSYMLQDDMARLQENGRFAFYLLAQDLRMAGYFGCRRDVPVTSMLDTTDTVFQFGNPVTGYEGSASGHSPALPVDLDLTDVDSGNDVLIVQRADALQTRLTSTIDETSTSAVIHVEAGHGISNGDIVMVSDCEAATVFQAGGSGAGPGNPTTVIKNTGQGDPGNLSKEFGHAYNEDSAQISKVFTTVFYVAPGVSGEPALFRKVNGGTAEELIDGVERFHVDYGLDPAGAGRVIRYESAADMSAAEWGAVSSVRISLLLRGRRDNMVDEPQSLLFNGEVVDGADRRLRSVITTTVAMRNRIR